MTSKRLSEKEVFFSNLKLMAVKRVKVKYCRTIKERLRPSTVEESLALPSKSKSPTKRRYPSKNDVVDQNDVRLMTPPPSTSNGGDQVKLRGGVSLIKSYKRRKSRLSPVTVPCSKSLLSYLQHREGDMEDSSSVESDTDSLSLGVEKLKSDTDSPPLRVEKLKSDTDSISLDVEKYKLRRTFVSINRLSPDKYRRQMSEEEGDEEAMNEEHVSGDENRMVKGFEVESIAGNAKSKKNLSDLIDNLESEIVDAEYFSSLGGFQNLDEHAVEEDDPVGEPTLAMRMVEDFNLESESDTEEEECQSVGAVDNVVKTEDIEEEESESVGYAENFQNTENSESDAILDLQNINLSEMEYSSKSVAENPKEEDNVQVDDEPMSIYLVKQQTLGERANASPNDSDPIISACMDVIEEDSVKNYDKGSNEVKCSTEINSGNFLHIDIDQADEVFIEEKFLSKEVEEIDNVDDFDIAPEEDYMEEEVELQTDQQEEKNPSDEATVECVKEKVSFLDSLMLKSVEAQAQLRESMRQKSISSAQKELDQTLETILRKMEEDNDTSEQNWRLESLVTRMQRESRREGRKRLSKRQDRSSVRGKGEDSDIKVRCSYQVSSGEENQNQNEAGYSWKVLRDAEQRVGSRLTRPEAGDVAKSRRIYRIDEVENTKEGVSGIVSRHCYYKQVARDKSLSAEVENMFVLREGAEIDFSETCGGTLGKMDEDISIVVENSPTYTMVDLPIVRKKKVKKKRRFDEKKKSRVKTIEDYINMSSTLAATPVPTPSDIPPLGEPSLDSCNIVSSPIKSCVKDVCIDNPFASPLSEAPPPPVVYRTESLLVKSSLTERLQVKYLLTESLQIKKSRAESLQEESSLAESLQVQPSLTEGLQIQPSLIEGVHVNNSLTEVLEVKPSLTDGLEVQPSLTDGLEVQPSLAEGLEFQPALTESLEVQPSLTEGLQVQTSLTEGLQFKSSLAEGLQVQSSLAEGLQVQSSLAEGLLVKSSLTDGLQAQPVTNSLHVKSSLKEGLPLNPSSILDQSSFLAQDINLSSDMEDVPKATLDVAFDEPTGLSEEVEEGFCQVVSLKKELELSAANVLEADTGAVTNVTEDASFEEENGQDLVNDSVDIGDSGDGKRYQCVVCSKELNTKNGLNYHMRTHSGLSPFECEVCHKRFKSSSLCSRHRQIHATYKKYVCGLCNKSFAQKSNLSKHMDIHAGLKPFQCPSCPKAFTQKVHLDCHLMTHTKDKPWKCKTCNTRFSKKSSLIRHCQNVHEDRSQVESRELEKSTEGENNSQEADMTEFKIIPIDESVDCVDKTKLDHLIDLNEENKQFDVEVSYCQPDLSSILSVSEDTLFVMDNTADKFEESMDISEECNKDLNTSEQIEDIEKFLQQSKADLSICEKDNTNLKFIDNEESMPKNVPIEVPERLSSDRKKSKYRIPKSPRKAARDQKIQELRKTPHIPFKKESTLKVISLSKNFSRHKVKNTAKDQQQSFEQALDLALTHPASRKIDKFLDKNQKAKMMVGARSSHISQVSDKEILPVAKRSSPPKMKTIPIKAIEKNQQPTSDLPSSELNIAGKAPISPLKPHLSTSKPQSASNKSSKQLSPVKSNQPSPRKLVSQSKMNQSQPQLIHSQSLSTLSISPPKQRISSSIIQLSPSKPKVSFSNPNTSLPPSKPLVTHKSGIVKHIVGQQKNPVSIRLSNSTTEDNIKLVEKLFPEKPAIKLESPLSTIYRPQSSFVSQKSPNPPVVRKVKSEPQDLLVNRDFNASKSLDLFSSTESHPKVMPHTTSAKTDNPESRDLMSDSGYKSEDLVNISSTTFSMFPTPVPAAPDSPQLIPSFTYKSQAVIEPMQRGHDRTSPDPPPQTQGYYTSRQVGAKEGVKVWGTEFCRSADSTDVESEAEQEAKGQISGLAPTFLPTNFPTFSSDTPPPLLARGLDTIKPTAVVSPSRPRLPSLNLPKPVPAALAPNIPLRVEKSLPSVVTTFMCSVCGSQFSNRANLVTHEQLVHWRL